MATRDRLAHGEDCVRGKVRRVLHHLLEKQVNDKEDLSLGDGNGTHATIFLPDFDEDLRTILYFKRNTFVVVRAVSNKLNLWDPAHQDSKDKRKLLDSELQTDLVTPVKVARAIRRGAFNAYRVRSLPPGLIS
jgi:hypothetical protein